MSMPGVTVTKIDKSKLFVNVNLDDVDFEEIVKYVEFAKDNQWVLGLNNTLGLRDDLVKDIVFDYYEKHDININPWQVGKIYDVLIELGINTDDTIYVKKNIAIEKMPVPE